MTTIPATASWFKRTTRSIHIPPVFLFLITSESADCSTKFIRMGKSFQPGNHAEYRAVGGIGLWQSDERQ
jgi:hypothetical protein